jgi:hypothetical protein
MTSKPRKPLPLSDILRDLAILRASALDIPEIFNVAQQGSDVISSTSSSPESTPSVAASYNYVATVRAAIKLNDSGKLGAEERKIEDARNKYEELDVCYVFCCDLRAQESMLVHTRQHTRARLLA